MLKHAEDPERTLFCSLVEFEVNAPTLDSPVSDTPSNKMQFSALLGTHTHVFVMFSDQNWKSTAASSIDCCAKVPSHRGSATRCDFFFSKNECSIFFSK